MREWHVKHMETAIVKYVTGLSINASSWEKRNHKKYGNIANVRRQLDYDIKHGATKDQALSILAKVRHDSSFSKLRKAENALSRLNEVQEHFAQPIGNIRW
jgi:enoyl reductase-like protein